MYVAPKITDRRPCACKQGKGFGESAGPVPQAPNLAQASAAWRDWLRCVFLFGFVCLSLFFVLLNVQCVRLAPLRFG